MRRLKVPEPSETMVHIVDDDAAMRNSLQFLMKAEGIPATTYESAQHFLDGYTVNSPGCLLVDVRMPGMSGLELHEVIKDKKIPIPVIIMTGHGDIPMAVQAMKAGALDFLIKPFDNDELLHRVRTCLGEGEDIYKAYNEHHKAEIRIALLTPREYEVMNLLVAGKPNKSIASVLEISTRTVELHRAKVMDKLEARSLSDVVRVSLQAEGKINNHAS